MRFLLVVFLFFSPVLLSAQDSLLRRMLTPAQLQADMALFRLAIEERHPGVDRYRAPGTFARTAEAVSAQLNQPRSVRDFYQLLAPAVDSIDCGHTELQLPKTYTKYLQKQAKQLPFRFHLNDTGLFVRVNYAGDSAVPVKLLVKKINGLPVDSLLHSWDSHMTSDGYNVTMKQMYLGRYFREEFAAFVGEPDTFLLEIAGKDQAVSYLRGKTKSFAQLDSIYKKRYEKLGTPKPLQLFLTDSTAQLSIRTFQYKQIRKQKQHYRRFVRRAFREIKKRNITDLTIDLRGNTGGEVPLGIFLYRQMAQNKFRYIDSITVKSRKPISFLKYTDRNRLFNTNLWLVRKRKGKLVYDIGGMTNTHKPVRNPYTGNVTVLVDPMTFSNASNFAALVQYEKRGKIKGTETGGAVNGCNGASYLTVTLPNSKISVRIPLGKVSYPFGPYLHFGRGVMPEKE